jgi:hypothetical protein
MIIVALSVAQYLLIEASANNISGILSVDAKYIVVSYNNTYKSKKTIRTL